MQMSAPRPAKTSSVRNGEQQWRDARFAMRISLVIGMIMLVSKLAAFFMTYSAAVFSDTAESVVHVVAVVFAAFSLRVSTKPAGSKFLYGYGESHFSRPDSKAR